MRISYHWLKEFTDLPQSPREVGTRLTHVGLALESLEETNGDSIFDFEVATNRPDCLSHLGIAREAAAAYGAGLRKPKFEGRESGRDASSVFSITIEAPDLCGRYCGRYIAGVKIGPSPDWLKNRLESIGIRSINNVADATNYVMMELGQPLHAFDGDTLQGRRIIVRRAELDEKMTTLDGAEHTLNPSTLLIADARHGVAIAGVMGGRDTEISLTTSNVLLESAHFDALSIRRTSRAIGLTTEASYRFERGSDPEMARYASDRAAALIQEVAGGEIYRGVIDVYPRKREPVRVQLRRARIRQFLGAPVDDGIVERIFRQLEFAMERTPEGWILEAPSHRIDIALEEDLLEEIARHYGFDKLPMTLPKWSGFGSALPMEGQERRLRALLAATGYTEICTYSFSHEDMERRFRPHLDPVRLQNPMAEDASILRASLVPGVLHTLQWNLNRGIRDLQFYELSKVYTTSGEKRELILGACGLFKSPDVHEPDREFGFYDLKGDVEQILDHFGVLSNVTTGGIPNYYHPGRAARFGEGIVLGELHPEFAETLRIRQRVYLAEIDVEPLMAMASTTEIRAIARYPGVRRDFSLLLDKAIRYAGVRETILSAGIPELAYVAPFDRMESGPFPAGKYSLSVSVMYQSHDRTLTDIEVEEFDRKVLRTLEKRLDAQLRK